MHRDQIEDEELAVFTVHRHLSEPIYRFRSFGLMLTDDDLFIVCILACAVWGAITYGGFGQVGVGPFTLDPFAYLLVGIVASYAVSLFHRLRPEATLSSIFRSGRLANHFAPYLSDGDDKWSEGAGRELSQVGNTQCEAPSLE